MISSVLNEESVADAAAVTADAATSGHVEGVVGGGGVGPVILLVLVEEELNFLLEQLEVLESWEEAKLLLLIQQLKQELKYKLLQLMKRSLNLLKKV